MAVLNDAKRQVLVEGAGTLAAACRRLEEGFFSVDPRVLDMIYDVAEQLLDVADASEPVRALARKLRERVGVEPSPDSGKKR